MHPSLTADTMDNITDISLKYYILIWDRVSVIILKTLKNSENSLEDNVECISSVDGDIRSCFYILRRVPLTLLTGNNVSLQTLGKMTLAL